MSILTDLQNTIAKKKLELQQLELAYSIIKKMEYTSVTADDPDSTPPAQSEPVPAPLPAANPEPRVEAPIPKPAYTGPKCGACNGKMYRSTRTMPSGMQVGMLKCNDSACGNEVYQ